MTFRMLLSGSLGSNHVMRHFNEESRTWKLFNTSKSLFTTGSPSHRVLLSGIQPTGRPHVGNYFGAIDQWRRLQGKYEAVMLAVVDLHSITLPQNPKLLRSCVLDTFATLLACGLDHHQTVIFQQSMIPEHAQLCWILGCLTTLNKLQHLPQWKEKSASDVDVPLGLFTYPVLQAADILLYKATDVPVGEDQVIHLELTRQLAKQFNNQYGKTFPIPQTIVGEYRRIRSLRAPDVKMSKSAQDPRSRIELFDTADDIREKIRKSVTDSTPTLTYEPIKRPGVANLFELHAAVRDCALHASVENDGFDASKEKTHTGACAHQGAITPQMMWEEHASLDTLAYKTVLADELVEYFRPIRDNILRLQADAGYLTERLEANNERARQIARCTYEQVAQRVGFK